MPLEIIDDEIVEDPHEYVRIRMLGSSGQQSLFGTGAFPEVSVTIVDNDSKYLAYTSYYEQHTYICYSMSLTATLLLVRLHSIVLNSTM